MTKARHNGRRKASAGGGLELYEINRTIRQMRGREFGDGTHIIYVNGATRSTSAIGRLVHDLLCRNAAEMYFDILKRQVSQFKNSEEGRHAMCKAVEELVERGKRETMLAMAKRMLKDGILALKDIARYTGLSLAQIKKLQPTVT